jgi:hypothetical protein
MLIGIGVLAAAILVIAAGRMAAAGPHGKRQVLLIGIRLSY